MILSENSVLLQSFLAIRSHAVYDAVICYFLDPRCGMSVPHNKPYEEP